MGDTIGGLPPDLLDAANKTASDDIFELLRQAMECGTDLGKVGDHEQAVARVEKFVHEHMSDINELRAALCMYRVEPLIFTVNRDASA